METAGATEDSRNVLSEKHCSCGATSSRCWCCDCSEPLCDDCVLAHRRVTVTRSHRILNQPPGNVSASATTFCRLHPLETLKLFCFTCGHYTCRDCQLMSHVNHRFQFVSEALDSIRQWLQASCQPIKAQKETTVQTMQDISTRLRDIVEGDAKMKTELKNAQDKFVTLLNKRIDMLMEDVERAQYSETERLQLQMQRLKQLQSKQLIVLKMIEQSSDINDLKDLMNWQQKINGVMSDLMGQDVAPPTTMTQLEVKTNSTSVAALLKFGFVEVTNVPFCVMQTTSCLTLSPTGTTSDSTPVDSESSHLSTTSSLAFPTSAGPFSSQTTTTGSTVSPLSIRSPSALLQPSSAPSSLPSSSKLIMPLPPVTNASITGPPNSSRPLVPSNQGQVIVVLRSVPPVVLYQSLPIMMTNHQNMLFSRSNTLPSNTRSNAHLSNQDQNTTSKNITTTVLTGLAATTQTSSKKYQQSQVVKAVADSVCDHVVQRQEPAENIPTSAMSEDAKQAENLPTSTVTKVIRPTEDIPRFNVLEEDIEPAENMWKSHVSEDNKSTENIPTSAMSEDIEFTENIPTSASSEDIEFTENILTSALSEDIEFTENILTSAMSEDNKFTENILTSAMSEDNKFTENILTSAMSEDNKSKENIPTSAMSEDNKSKENIPTSALSEDAEPAENILTSVMSENIQSFNMLEEETEAEDAEPAENIPRFTASLKFESEPSFFKLPWCLLQPGRPLLHLSHPAENSQTSPKPPGELSAPQTTPRTANKSDFVIGQRGGSVNHSQPTVSPFRLPLSMLRPGHPLICFSPVPGDSEDKGDMSDEKAESTDENFSEHWKDFTRPLSSPESPGCPESPVTLHILSCSVCGLSHSSIICSSCGRGYHRDCHVPPVGPHLWVEWNCSLCQDLSDLTDPFSSERRVQSPERRGLNVLDQRKCETLLLHLLVGNCHRLSQDSHVSSGLSMISERLTLRCSPPYEKTTEFLFNVRSVFREAPPQDDRFVDDLQQMFHRRVKEMFGSKSDPSDSQRCRPGAASICDVSKLKETRKRLKDYLDLKLEPKVKRTTVTTMNSNFV